MEERYRFAIGALAIPCIIGGIFLLDTHPVWAYVLLAAGVLSIIWGLWPMIKRRRFQKPKGSIIQITDIYEDNKGECGLIFRNTSSNNLTNCQARLIDLAFEKQHARYSLERYPKAEDLVCAEKIAGFGDAKIPLFRWEWSGGSKDLEIVYKSGTQKIGYGILNVPILVLLNVWADNVQNTYAICKLEDRLGWGYSLSILKTGILQGDVKLTTYQKPTLGTDTDYQA